MARIIGEKIILREYQKEDLAPIRQWVVNSEITDLLSDNFLFPNTLTQTEFFLNGRLEDKDDNYRGFVIAKKETLEYLGQIDLISINWKNRSALLGIVLAKEAQNQGFGSESIQLIQQFVFNSLNLHRLELNVLGTNLKAQYCYKKCGFQIEGCKKDAVYQNGQYVNMVQMAVLKPEWLATIAKIQ